MSDELIQIEAAIEATRAVSVPDPIRAALVADLRPVAERLAGYERAATLAVIGEPSAQEAKATCDAIAADIKAVKESEVLSKITAGLHDLHRKWTGLRDLFVGPLERDRRIIKGKIIAWQESERLKAEELQRKLQAEADAKAKAERDKQEAEARRQREIEDAARRKAEDARRAAEQAQGTDRARLQAEANAAERKANAAAIKADARTEQAASVAAPTINVPAPKTGIKTQSVWKIKNIDSDQFCHALATRPDLRGFITIEQARMERAKAANPMTEIPGVVFEKITR